MNEYEKLKKVILEALTPPLEKIAEISHDLSAQIQIPNMEILKDISRIALPTGLFEGVKEILNKLPKDTRETQLYAKVSEFYSKSYTISIKDSEWLIERFSIDDVESAMNDFMRCEYAVNPYAKYIQQVIGSNELSEREKLILVLSHFEGYIRNNLGKTTGNLKTEAKNMIDTHHDMNMHDWGLVYVLAIICFVYERTEDKEFDKRVPHRHDILHNGIVEYTDSEICDAYGNLKNYIAIIHLVTFQGMDS